MRTIGREGVRHWAGGVFRKADSKPRGNDDGEEETQETAEAKANAAKRA
jgi:hypothetical protein